METINVLVLAGIGDARVNQIKKVSPRLKVTDASGFAGIANFSDSRKRTPEAEKRLDELLAETEIIYTYLPLPGLVSRAPALKWIQIIPAGAEHVLSPELAASKVILTNSKGIHAAQISELVFEMLLMQVKNGPENLRNQQERKWGRSVPGVLTGKTLGIIGYGSIGKGIARLGKAFGMRVLGTRRSAVEVSHERYVEGIYPHKDIGLVLKESDFVVLALPSTPETFKIFGEKELALMKPSSFLVNIGRGSTLDEEALVRALQEKRIAGAGLDTFIKEPLPAESPLWGMPNVIITPHIAGVRADLQDLATDVFCENLKRYLAGKRLLNVVNKKLGY